MPIRMLCLLLALPVMLATGGCAVLQQAVSPPELDLREVRLVKADLRSQHYEVVLAAHNPNSFSIGLQTIEWQLALAGHDFAEGRLALAESLPAGKSVPLTLEMQTNLLDYARHAFNQLTSGDETVEYQLTGTAQIDSPVRRSVPFDERGRIEIRR